MSALKPEGPEVLRAANPTDSLSTLARAWTFSRIGREERHLVAILFHLLNSSEKSMVRFLELFEGESTPAYLNAISRTQNRPFEAANIQVSVYFEYAHLRDIWSNIGAGEQANRIKRAIITQTLLDLCGGEAADQLRKRLTAPDSVRDFNLLFQLDKGANKPSTKYIQSPRGWQLQALDRLFFDMPCEGVADPFQKACMLKWAFNIKPDLVIHLHHADGKTLRVLCIEAKFASAESRYPSSSADVAVLKAREKRHATSSHWRVGRVELQQFMFDQVLKIQGVQGRPQTCFGVIQKKLPTKSSTNDVEVRTWSQVFKAMGTEALPNYMNHAIQLASEADV